MRAFFCVCVCLTDKYFFLSLLETNFSIFRVKSNTEGSSHETDSETTCENKATCFCHAIALTQLFFAYNWCTLAELRHTQIVRSR